MKLPAALLAAVLAVSLFGEAAAQQNAEQSTAEVSTTDAWKTSASTSSSDLQAEFDQPCADGMAGQFPCQNVDLLSFLPIDSLGGRRGPDGKPITSLNDIWGWTDPETGNEYALVGRTDGTSFVDVTDPTEPVFIGDLPSHNGYSSVWRDVKTLDHYALVVMDGRNHGLQVFDLHRLRDVADPPVTFEPSAHFGTFSAHNIVVNEATRYAYAVGSNACLGLYGIDLSNPEDPVPTTCYVDLRTGFGDGYTHDAQCVMYHGPDEDYFGREICLASNESHILIADVTDKANISTISIAEYPDVRYAHQGWLTEDQRYFLQDDELDHVWEQNARTRTLIWDLTQLDDPQLVGIYTGPTEAIDHNQYTLENRTFQSNYTSGLRILDISNPAQPEEVGYFDSFPAHDSAEFSGSWSNYPYFESGNIIMTGIDEGLFVVRPTGAAVPIVSQEEVPEKFQLLPAFPNPFNPQSTIEVLVDEPQRIRVAVFDAQGAEITELYSGFVATPGRLELTIDGRDLASGVYFVRAFGASGSQTRPVTLQK